MSASTTPTFCTAAASAAARVTVTEDLPTPPLPLATAYTPLSAGGWADGITSLALHAARAAGHPVPPGPRGRLGERDRRLRLAAAQLGLPRPPLFLAHHVQVNPH